MNLTSKPTEPQPGTTLPPTDITPVLDFYNRECSGHSQPSYAQVWDLCSDAFKALEKAQRALRIAYAAAYCGPQNWTPEQTEQFRVESCAADMEMTRVLNHDALQNQPQPKTLRL